MESKNRKLWILSRNEGFLGYIKENPLVAQGLHESVFEPVFISELIDLKMVIGDKALVFQPETEEALCETTSPDLWRKFRFDDAMFNDNIYAVDESELWKRILDGSIFTRIQGVIAELSELDRRQKSSEAI